MGRGEGCTISGGCLPSPHFYMPLFLRNSESSLQCHVRRFVCVCRERVAQHLDQPPVHPPPTAFHVSLVFSFSVVESLPYRVLCVGTVTSQSTGVFCNYVGEKTQELREKHGQSAEGAPPQEPSQPQQSSPLPSSGARSSCQFSSSPFLFRLEESSQGHDVALSCTSMYGPDNTYAQHTRRRRGSEGSPREGGGIKQQQESP